MNPIQIGTPGSRKWPPFHLERLLLDGLYTWRHNMRREPCTYCGNAGGTIDHIHPRVQGGINGWENETACCTRCNSLKDRKPALFFFLQRRRPSGISNRGTQ